MDELPTKCSDDLQEDEIGEPTHEFVLEEGDMVFEVCFYLLINLNHTII